MIKSDLKDGYVVDLRCGLRRVVLFEQLLIDYDDKYEVSSDLTEEYRENLTHRSDSNLDIVKIYDNDMELLWEREEVDWSKVPVGTKVLVSDNGEKEHEGYFIGYRTNNEFYKFHVLIKKGNLYESSYWEHCKLAEKPKEEVTYNDMIDEFNEYCNAHIDTHDSCMGCDYEDGGCNTSKFMKDRFTIIRK